MDPEREWVKLLWGQGEQERRKEEREENGHPLHVWSPPTFSGGRVYACGRCAVITEDCYYCFVANDR